MSDHEGHGADEWEEGSLPGGPPLPSQHDSLSRPVHQTFSYLHPNPPNSNFQRLPNEFHQANGYGVPRGARNGLHQKPQQTQRFGYRPQIQGLEERPGGIQTRQGNVPKVNVENSAYASWKNGNPHNGQYTFCVVWETLLSNFPQEGLPASKVARNRLDEICSTTETYIPTPQSDTNTVSIYGNESQVAHARQKLEYFEKDVRGVRGVRPSTENWIKMKALDGRREHRDERETKLQEYLRLYRQSEDDLLFDFDDYFFWPTDPDLEQFIAEYDSTVMDEIRRKSLCRIEYDTSRGLVHTSAQSDVILHQIRNRIVNLIREMVARLNQRLRVNLFHLPSGPIYRNRVGLDQDPSTDLFMPTLHGEGLPQGEEKDWARLCRRINRRNREQVGAAIEKTLRNLQLSDMHVRMRVTFGELGFRRHRRPADGQDSHSFDEFCEMMRNERTELRQQGIRSIGGEISGIVDTLSETGAFWEPTESYSVYFDFCPPGQSSTLRLECEFRAGNELKELEVAQQRWLEFKAGAQSDLLEINVLDFERPNWQLHLGATSFYDNKFTKGPLDAFQRNLGFTVPPNGIKSSPKRRAIFQPGHHELRFVSELTLLRFSSKNSDGTLELRRTDVYDEAPGQSSPHPLSSVWTAAYYYPHWDNLLGEYGYIKPGQQVSWHRSLATFFPDDSNDAKPEGFKRFFREVEEIQELLFDAIANLSKVQTNDVH